MQALLTQKPQWNDYLTLDQISKSRYIWNSQQKKSRQSIHCLYDISNFRMSHSPDSTQILARSGFLPFVSIPCLHDLEGTVLLDVFSVLPVR